MRKAKNRSAAEVKADIRRDIEASYRPGALLPTRREMVDAYGASSHTIQSALCQLRDEGVVVIRPSVGTVVAPDVGTGPQLIERASAGRIYPPGEYATFTFCGMDFPPGEVTDALDLSGAEAAIVRRRQHRTAEGAVLSESASWYHPSYRDAAPRLLERERIIEGSYMYLIKQTGLRAATKDVWVVSREATEYEAETLALGPSGTVLVERTVIKTRQGEHIEYGISSRPGHVPYPVHEGAPIRL